MPGLSLAEEKGKHLFLAQTHAFAFILSYFTFSYPLSFILPVRLTPHAFLLLPIRCLVPNACLV
jgi:hypothetical protein